MISKLPFLGSLPPRDHSLPIRDRIDTLSEELATERHADLGQVLRSDFSRVSMAAHNLRTFEIRAASLSQAALWGDTIQTTLDRFSTNLTRVTEAVSPSLMGAADPELSGLGRIGADALTDMLSALDARLGGRALFNNGQYGNTPWPAVETVEADLTAIAVTATDLAGLTTAIDAYFDPTGPFAAALTTSAGDPVTFPFGDGESAQFTVAADTAEIRDALRDVALISVLPDVPFALDQADRSALTGQLVAGLSDGKAGLARLQGQIGTLEARIADITDHQDRERARAESALAGAIAPDPFELATHLQAEMSRLEATYAITARRAQLRLTDFIR